MEEHPTDMEDFLPPRGAYLWQEEEDDRETFEDSPED